MNSIQWAILRTLSRAWFGLTVADIVSHMVNFHGLIVTKDEIGKELIKMEKMRLVKLPLYAGCPWHITTKGCQVC